MPAARLVGFVGSVDPPPGRFGLALPELANDPRSEQGEKREKRQQADSEPPTELVFEANQEERAEESDSRDDNENGNRQTGP